MATKSKSPDVSIEVVCRHIAVRLDEQYHDYINRLYENIPLAARAAHLKLLAAAFGPVKERQILGVQADLSRANRYHHDVELLSKGLAEDMSHALRVRLGRPAILTFYELEIPMAVEAAYVQRITNGPIVRVIRAYDAMVDRMTIRADVSVSLLGPECAS